MSDYNSANVRSLDDRSLQLKGEIAKLEQAEKFAKRKDVLLAALIKIRNEVSGLKLGVESKLNSAKKRYAQ